MNENEEIKTEFLLQEIRIALKDIFVATVHRCKDGINIHFPNGQTFVLALWEQRAEKANKT